MPCAALGFHCFNRTVDGRIVHPQYVCVKQRQAWLVAAAWWWEYVGMNCFLEGTTSWMIQFNSFPETENPVGSHEKHELELIHFWPRWVHQKEHINERLAF